MEYILFLNDMTHKIFICKCWIEKGPTGEAQAIAREIASNAKNSAMKMCHGIVY